MEEWGRLLILFGLFSLLLGLLFVGGKRFPFGRLPGDFLLQKENFTLFLPLTTSLLLSIILTIILNLFLNR